MGEKKSFNQEQNMINIRDRHSNSVADNQRKFMREANRWNAKSLYAMLNQAVIGQEEELFKASILISSFIRSASANDTAERPHFIIEGLSGCGKSTFANALKEILRIPVVILDASQITQTGFKGVDVTDAIFCEELARFDMSGIVILDEIDKLIQPRYGGTGATEENVNRIVQENFLKILDGGTMTTGKGDSYYTGRLLFIGLGAFTPLREEKKKKNSIGFFNDDEDDNAEDNTITKEKIASFGQSEQFIGRFTTVLHFKAVEEHQIKRIAYRCIDEVLSACMMPEVVVDMTERDKIAELCIDKAKSSEFGCRAIKSFVWEYVFENMMDFFTIEDLAS